MRLSPLRCTELQTLAVLTSLDLQLYPLNSGIPCQVLPGLFLLALNPENFLKK